MSIKEKIAGKEKQIGAISAIILMVVAAIAGFSSDAFKDGFCGCQVGKEIVLPAEK